MAVAEPVVVGMSDRRRRTRPSEILVGHIDHGLRVRHIVDSRNRSMTNPNAFMDNLDHGGETIGRAGRGGDDVVDLGIVEVVVDAHHDVQGALLDRRGDDDFGARRA